MFTKKTRNMFLFVLFLQVQFIVDHIDVDDGPFILSLAKVKNIVEYQS